LPLGLGIDGGHVGGGLVHQLLYFLNSQQPGPGVAKKLEDVGVHLAGILLALVHAKK